MADIGGDHSLCAVLDEGSPDYLADIHRRVNLFVMEGGLVLTLFADRTDGSYLERKETGLIWHYEHTDSEFGQYQAKDLYGHLEVTLGGSHQVRLNTWTIVTDSLSAGRNFEQEQAPRGEDVPHGQGNVRGALAV